MKCFPATKRDNERGVMRCELTGDDVELLEEAAYALEQLAQIEDILGVVAVQSPFITGTDIPTATREASRLLLQLQIGWDGEVFHKMLKVIESEKE